MTTTNWMNLSSILSACHFCVSLLYCSRSCAHPCHFQYTKSSLHYDCITHYCLLLISKLIHVDARIPICFAVMVFFSYALQQFPLDFCIQLKACCTHKSTQSVDNHRNESNTKKLSYHIFDRYLRLNDDIFSTFSVNY